MKLAEVFEQLTTSEMSQLYIGGAEEGGISEAEYPKVVNHINLALTALYKRFFLKEGRITLAPVLGQMLYPIKSKYAVSSQDSVESVRFILDSLVEPFQDDILKVEAIQTNSEMGIPLNDSTDPYSIFTPSLTTLRIPSCLIAQGSDTPDKYKTSTLIVVYRASHPKLNVDDASFDPETVELELPESHLEALLLYVASRANTPTGMVNEFNAGNNYASKYELECQRLEMSNFQINSGTSNTRLEDNGWV